MSYKTILVYLNDRRRAERLLTVAIALAQRWNAHLVALHVYPSVPQLSVFGISIGGETVGAILAHCRREAEYIKAAFDRMTANQPIVAEWVCSKTIHTDLAQVVMDSSRAADLVVVSQADPDWDMAPALDFPERLAIECGRPVLMIPNNGHVGAIGRNVLLAWNGSREATRATFDSLPLLAGADSVRVLGVAEAGSMGSGAEARRLPDPRIASVLARHGVKVRLMEARVGNQSVPEEILARAAENDSDLLVMGAYGHSRFRELIVGGATRHVARHTNVPTLLSH